MRFVCLFCLFFQNKLYCIGSLPFAWLVQKTDTHGRLFQKFVLVTFEMWTENKLLSRKGIRWKQNDNLITQYEHEYTIPSTL